LCAWLFSVSRVLADHERTVVASDDGVRFSTGAADERSAAAAAGARADGESKDQAQAVMIRQIERGSKFTLYAVRGPRTVKTDVFMFYRDDPHGEAGAVYLSQPGAPLSVTEATPLPLEDIKTVTIGKTGQILPTLATKADPDCCMTIAASDPSLTLDLEASSASTIITWKLALDALLKNHRH